MSDTAPTMRDTIERTGAELKEKGSAAEEKVSRGTEAETAASAPNDDDPLSGWAEAPPWSKRWGKDSAKALRAYATDPNNGENWKHIGNELNKLYTDWGKQANEVGQLRSIRDGYAPIHDMLQQANQRFTMQGMSLPQGLAQMFAVQQALEQNPDRMLADLVSAFKPKDAAKFIQGIAQSLGANLGDLANAAPYIDPQISQMVNPVMQRLQAIEQNLSTQQNAQIQAQQHFVYQQIQAFENAVDDTGQPKHPYLRDPEVFSLMLTAMNNGHTPRDLSAAYEWATARHLPAIQAKAKAAEAVALREAARTTENSHQAKQASNNLNGSAARGRAGNDNPSMREAMAIAAKQLA